MAALSYFFDVSENDLEVLLENLVSNRTLEKDLAVYVVRLLDIKIVESWSLIPLNMKKYFKSIWWKLGQNF